MKGTIVHRYKRGMILISLEEQRVTGRITRADSQIYVTRNDGKGDIWEINYPPKIFEDILKEDNLVVDKIPSKYFPFARF